MRAAHPDAGHTAAFKRAARALGLTGRMTATVPGDGLGLLGPESNGLW